MKKSIAVDNGTAIFVLFLMCTCVWTYYIWQNDSIGEKVLCVFILMIEICFVATSPHYFTADEKGLTVFYIFLLKDYYAWEDVRSIEEIRRCRSVWYCFDTKEHTKKAFLWHLNFIKALC